MSSRAFVRHLAVGWICGLALVTAACEGPPAAAPVEYRVPVAVRDVGTGDVEDRVVVTGTLRAPERVALSVETRGALRIARGPKGRRWTEGDRVRAGQLIAEVTGEDARLAARLETVRLRYDAALKDLEAQRRLYDEGLVSEQQVRQQETSVSDLKAELDQSQLTQARTRMVTPISGVILRLARDSSGMPVADGQLAASGMEVAVIAPSDSLVAEVDLLGPDLPKVRPGLDARVRHYAWPGEEFEGRVIRLAPTIDPTTRTVLAEVGVENRDGKLRPGMFVEVTLISEQRQDVPVVPREAVTERGGQRVVFLLDGQRVVEQAVILGLGDDETVEVRQGVQVGDRVVVRGLETLMDKTRVRVTEG